MHLQSNLSCTLLEWIPSHPLSPVLGKFKIMNIEMWLVNFADKQSYLHLFTVSGKTGFMVDIFI